MEYIDSDIQAELDTLNSAIKKRLSPRKGKVPPKDVLGSEELICITSRALYSVCVDKVLWSGRADKDVLDEVLRTLRKALASISLDPQCKASVSERLNEFEKLYGKIEMNADVATTGK